MDSSHFPEKNGSASHVGGGSAPAPSSFSRRAALALAEAIIPGSSAIPMADEASVAASFDVVRSFDPALVAAWTAALTTLSAAAVAQTGRAFHALDANAQDALLAKWERDSVLRTPLNLVATILKFVHFDRLDVYTRMGGKPNVVEKLEQPRWLQQITRGEDLPDNEDIECEVVVVGTGAGGAVVGKELADRGFAVAFLEEGEHYRRDAFDGSSVRAHQKFYRAAFTVGNAIMPVFMGRLMGGSTAINGGTSFRTPSWVLDRWCESFDNDEFSPANMQRHFERVEKFLEVGASEPRHIGPIADVMRRGSDALGWHHFALNRNAPGCDGQGFCDFGCRTDARRGMNISYIPNALEKGAVVFTGLAANEVIVENGRAAGVRAKDKQGRTVTVRAKAVVLSGGSIPTPLLLLSQGIANASGEVGRNLTTHPSTGMSALFDDEINAHKHIPQGYGMDQFQREGIMVLAAQPDRNIAWVLFPQTGRRLMDNLARVDNVASFALMLYDTAPAGRVWRTALGLPAITYNFARRDVEQMQRATVITAQMCMAAGAKEIYPVVYGAPKIKTKKELDAFANASLSPGDFAWTSYHPLGTCKMGKDARTSVVDLEHESHDIDHLFIVDGSTVPSALGVNPQLTIMAMATRAAEKIAERI